MRKEKGFTYGCQCDETVISRYCVVPSFKVGEEHRRKEYEDDHSRQQVNDDLSDQAYLWRHPIVIC